MLNFEDWLITAHIVGVKEDFFFFLIFAIDSCERGS